MNVYLLAHQTLVAQLQILTRDLWHNGIISQQKVLPTVLNLFAIKLTKIPLSPKFTTAQVVGHK
jgi:hypothetical protein